MYQRNLLHASLCKLHIYIHMTMCIRPQAYSGEHEYTHLFEADTGVTVIVTHYGLIRMTFFTMSEHKGSMKMLVYPVCI